MVVGDFPIAWGTVVVDAGRGGFVAGILAEQQGLKVVITVKGILAGECSNDGCILSIARIIAAHRFENEMHYDDRGITTEYVIVDFTRVLEWKTGVGKILIGGAEGHLIGNTVVITRAEVYFADVNILPVTTEVAALTYMFKIAVPATVSIPIEILGFIYSKRVINSTGALILPESPIKLVVIGGAYIDMESGTAFANFVTEVIVVVAGVEISAGFEIAMTSVVIRAPQKTGNVTIHIKATAKGVEGTETVVKDSFEVTGEIQTVEVDYVEVTVGRRPNIQEIGLEQVGGKMTDRGLIEFDEQCGTNVSNINAIADIFPAPPLAHKATYEGSVALEALSVHASAIDDIGFPAVSFTHPELSSVGYSKKQASEAGLTVTLSKFPFAANGSALSLYSTYGFLGLVTHKEDGHLVGALVAGVGASDINSEIALAIVAGMRAEVIAQTIHDHPTQGEIRMEAAVVALRMPIYIVK
nr:dihydrolipoyl dehydrogenase [Lysinibacillus sp.]